MKKLFSFFFCVLLVLLYPSVRAQAQDAISRSSWDHDLDINFYLMKDDFFVLPIYRGDIEKFHLEMRYNYEDNKTFSIWYGYNFKGGNNFEYFITPMLGGIIGNINALGAGLEMTFSFKGFEFYSESEYIFDMDARSDDYYYNWTDLSYSPLDWLWFGLSAQRTRLYETRLEIQRGLLIGGGFKWFGLNGYLYNIGWDDPYFILTLTVIFPED